MTAPLAICTVRDCPIHSKPKIADLVTFNKDGSISINVKPYVRWYLRYGRRK